MSLVSLYIYVYSSSQIYQLQVTLLWDTFAYDTVIRASRTEAQQKILPRRPKRLLQIQKIG